MPDAQIIALSVGETAYQRIRSDLVFGRIAPGQRLRLDRMKAETGLSHDANLVRLALHYLTERFNLNVPARVFQCRVLHGDESSEAITTADVIKPRGRRPARGRAAD